MYVCRHWTGACFFTHCDIYFLFFWTVTFLSLESIMSCLFVIVLCVFSFTFEVICTALFWENVHCLIYWSASCCLFRSNRARDFPHSQVNMVDRGVLLIGPAALFVPGHYLFASILFWIFDFYTFNYNWYGFVKWKLNRR